VEEEMVIVRKQVGEKLIISMIIDKFGDRWGYRWL